MSCLSHHPIETAGGRAYLLSVHLATNERASYATSLLPPKLAPILEPDMTSNFVYAMLGYGDCQAVRADSTTTLLTQHWVAAEQLSLFALFQGLQALLCLCCHLIFIHAGHDAGGGRGIAHS